MIDLKKMVRRPAHRMLSTLARGVAVGSMVALGLGAGGVSQALAAPSLDPGGSYLWDSVQQQTVILSPAYSIGPWQTIRQTYDCGGGTVVLGQNLLGFLDNSSPNVSAVEDGGGPGLADVSVLFTNWNFGDAQYQVQYACNGHVLRPVTQPQPQPQPLPVPPTPTAVPTRAPAPQPQPVPNYYQYQYQYHSHW